VPARGAPRDEAAIDVVPERETRAADDRLELPPESLPPQLYLSSLGASARFTVVSEACGVGLRWRQDVRNLRNLSTGHGKRVRRRPRSVVNGPVPYSACTRVSAFFHGDVASSWETGVQKLGARSMRVLSPSSLRSLDRRMSFCFAPPSSFGHRFA
jgi:hypothetical protein